MKPTIDLTRHHFQRHIGDMTIYGTWIFNQDQEDTEPCLAILPRYRTIGVMPCCVALSAAFRYANPRYLAHAARQFSKAMGFEDDLTRTRKIAELIYDHLPDLISMPVDPVRQVVVADATVTAESGRKKSLEVVDYEQIAQA